MTDLIIRNLDRLTEEQLSARAARNGRSLEAEARSILTAAAGGPTALDIMDTVIPSARRMDEEAYRDFRAALEAADNLPDPPSFS